MDDPRFEHDGCGVGFVANLNGQPTHSILRHGLTALINLAHRGAVSADGLSGDGAGIMTQIPTRLLRSEVTELASGQAATGRIGVGMIFLSSHARDRLSEFEQISSRELDRVSCRFIARRPVPVDTSHLGPHAISTLPEIQQIIFLADDSIHPDALERNLFVARRRIQKAAAAAGLEPFHICSMSTRTVVYKGLVVPSQLASFFTDLRDNRYETSTVVFHQRFSTNTLPAWHLAQPFRMLAHNGEINSLRGNLLWMAAREPLLHSSRIGDDLADVLPVVNAADSDSASLDRALELLVRAGHDHADALSTLMPEPYRHMPDMDADVRAMYEYRAAACEPWEGPAALVVYDGTRITAALDRNGLRPFRFWRTCDGLVVGGSETGILPIPPECIAERGRLGPGQMITIDATRGKLIHNDELKQQISARYPYRTWRDRAIRDMSAEQRSGAVTMNDDQRELVRLQIAFGYGREDIHSVIEPMAHEARPATGAMGDDTPLALLSSRPQPLYRYFKQCFAQVTNPPLDSIRERLVMSLDSVIGSRPNALEIEPNGGPLLRYASPIIGPTAIEHLCSGQVGLRSTILNTTFPIASGPAGLAPAVESLCEQAEAAASDGSQTIILTDRRVDASRAPIPMMLATSAVHQRLIERGLRQQVSIVCEAGDARDDHQIACLVGCGASLVSPWLALESLAALAGTPADAVDRYVRAIEQGLLKVLARMGICSIDSYRGARLFEAIGLDEEIIAKYFPNVPCRINGVGLEQVARDVLTLHTEAFGTAPKLRELGRYRFRRDGEHHAFNPIAFKLLHKAVRTGDRRAYEEYAAAVEKQPLCNLRDLLQWRPLGPPIPVEQVEHEGSIATRFCTQAMSLGSLSPEAHELMSVAMNRLGGRSNSGEGGEAPERSHPHEASPGHFLSAWRPEPGDHGGSAIRQIASGRFGVTAHYLRSAREIEIKIAQGAKPGEGGQIPGHKVVGLIARLRRAAPGTTLISPPPHHDIYSIEDLEQLIYDLRRVNPDARITVKLVALAGIGTIAAGVAKAYADCIQISGHDGGTGASPLSSIYNAGLPWEIGLAEVQQVLVRNDLRSRVAVRVDGGLRTGRDVLVAAMLGAEEFGFGTAALIASGCVMARQCHANTCPVGIATQRDDLREKFPGRPEHVIRFMLYVASQVRMLLSSIGASRLDDVIGRCDLLHQRSDIAPSRAPGVDLSPILADPSATRPHATRRTVDRNIRPEHAEPLDERVFRDCRDAINHTHPVMRRYAIDNRQRSVGARLAGHLAISVDPATLPDEAVRLHFEGVAGQSFGAFCTNGMSLELRGEAQDYVGKSMDGGRIVIYLRRQRHGSADRMDHVLLGNTALYGATGGRLFAAGRAGERFAVRNSGALAVVEGCGDHACEYMTGGTVVILGPVGRNLAAGMSGGRAYVLDPIDYLPRHVNTETVQIARLTDHAEQDRLFDVITIHSALTRSSKAVDVLRNWSYSVRHMWVVAPRQEPAGDSQSPQTPEIILRTGARSPLRSRDGDNTAGH